MFKEKFMFLSLSVLSQYHIHVPPGISCRHFIAVFLGDDDFDVFAQSRKYDTKAPSAAASYSYQAEAGQTSSSMGAAASGRGNPYDQEVSDDHKLSIILSVKYIFMKFMVPKWPIFLC